MYEQRRLTQSERILEYIKSNGSITQKDAYREFDCMRLAAQIYILKSRGIPIKSTMETSKNKYGNSVSYARYSICE